VARPSDVIASEALWLPRAKRRLKDLNAVFLIRAQSHQSWHQAKP
jgi:hypothetical protein